MRNGTDAERNGTDAERNGTDMGLKRVTDMGLKCGTERNGYGVKIRNGTDGVKMRNGTKMRLKLNLKPISVPFRILTPYPFRSAF